MLDETDRLGYIRYQRDLYSQSRLRRHTCIALLNRLSEMAEDAICRAAVRGSYRSARLDAYRRVTCESRPSVWSGSSRLIAFATESIRSLVVTCPACHYFLLSHLPLLVSLSPSTRTARRKPISSSLFNQLPAL